MAIIRKINPESEDEINLVASRMRDTLVDVLGEKKGVSLYSEKWLKERVLWHLSPDRTTAIFLGELDNHDIVAQAIVRTEKDSKGTSYGYFSTIYVTPESRGHGIAKQLIEVVENWCLEKQMTYVTYNTASDNYKVINLFKKYYFEIIHKENNMVQLQKNLLAI